MIQLCSLQREYTTFVNSMINVCNKINLSDVKVDLHDEALRGNLTITSLDSSEGLFTHRGRSKCKHGHLVAQCTKLERKIKI